MIVEVQVDIGAPVSEVLDRITGRLATHGFDDVVTADFVDTHVTLQRAGLAGLTTQVAVQTLRPLVSSDRVVIPIRWEAIGATGQMFPTLDADVMVAPSGDGSSLRLVGSYVPPFGRAGAAADRLVMHRVAVITLRRFLGHLVDEATESNTNAVG